MTALFLFGTDGAMALMTDSRLVTADRKLFDAVKDAAPIKKHMLWIEDVPGKGL